MRLRSIISLGTTQYPEKAARRLYDVWGDAVNVASRMESTGQPGRIQVSAATFEKLKDTFDLEPRGPIEVKGKGRMKTWYLAGRRSFWRSLLPGRSALPWREENLARPKQGEVPVRLDLRVVGVDDVVACHVGRHRAELDVGIHHDALGERILSDQSRGIGRNRRALAVVHFGIVVLDLGVAALGLGRHREARRRLGVAAKLSDPSISYSSGYDIGVAALE
jgi:Adenylate and Guanylate cyclase catalytic domain